MLQDTQTIRYYQKLTDALVEMWNRGYRSDDLRLYLDGYLAALRQGNAIEPYLIHRLALTLSKGSSNSDLNRVTGRGWQL